MKLCVYSVAEEKEIGFMRDFILLCHCLHKILMEAVIWMRFYVSFTSVVGGFARKRIGNNDLYGRKSVFFDTEAFQSLQTHFE